MGGSRPVELIENPGMKLPHSLDQDPAGDLLARAAAGTLDSAGTQRLLEICQTRGEVLEELASQVLTERLLWTVARDPEGRLLERELRLVLQAQGKEVDFFADRVTSALRQRQTFRTWLRRAALFLLFAGAAGGVFKLRPVAKVLRADSWATFSPGQTLLRGQRLVLESGLMALQFASGAEVILEGPAEMWVQSAWNAQLRRGRAVARVPERGRGFSIEGPGGRLVDLGTEFGVAVGNEGSMEVHVLEGVVEAHPKSHPGKVRLLQNEALRLEAHTASRLPADRGGFITALPPRDPFPKGFIHWGFEGEGPSVPNTGMELGGNSAGLEFAKATENVDLPQRVPGRFGQGLQFNGDGGFARSDFLGIGGAHPRTVAFWVKVPKAFDPAHGYGIVGWGSHREPGAAWQISINPVQEEGPLGRLRVGVTRAPVVGTTDLRDDRWHHCAVVMYGGVKADLSTHVLLYVDGSLEPAARKAVMGIDTDLSAKRNGVWLGRNISGSAAGFRGGVDEVYIYESALDHAQVDALFRENRPPSPARTEARSGGIGPVTHSLRGTGSHPGH
jgi:hypothetical protein